MKYFIDTTADLWADNSLVGKPASVFVLAHPSMAARKHLTHHDGAVIAPRHVDSRAALSIASLASNPQRRHAYGVTHLQGSDDPAKLSDEKASLAISAGEQLALVAQRLNAEQ